RLVGEHGENKWGQVCDELNALFPGCHRTSKQCREKWNYQLCPSARKGHPGMPWTAAEELILVRAHQEQGNRWSEISKLLPERTETNVKNHWNTALRRKHPARCIDNQVSILDQYQHNFGFKSFTAEALRGLNCIGLCGLSQTSSLTEMDPITNGMTRSAHTTPGRTLVEDLPSPSKLSGAAAPRPDATSTPSTTGQAGTLHTEIPRIPFMGPPAAAHGTPAGARSSFFASSTAQGGAATAVSHAVLPQGNMHQAASMAVGLRGLNPLDEQHRPHGISVPPGWWQGSGCAAKEAAAVIGTPASKLAEPAGVGTGGESPITPMHAAELAAGKAGMDGRKEGQGGKGVAGAHEGERISRAEAEVQSGTLVGEVGAAHAAWQVGGGRSEALMLQNGVQRSESPGPRDGVVQGQEVAVRRGSRARRSVQRSESPGPRDGNAQGQEIAVRRGARARRGVHRSESPGPRDSVVQGQEVAVRRGARARRGVQRSQSPGPKDGNAQGQEIAMRRGARARRSVQRSESPGPKDGIAQSQEMAVRRGARARRSMQRSESPGPEDGHAQGKGEKSMHDGMQPLAAEFRGASHHPSAASAAAATAAGEEQLEEEEEAGILEAAGILQALQGLGGGFEDGVELGALQEKSLSEAEGAGECEAEERGQKEDGEEDMEGVEEGGGEEEEEGSAPADSRHKQGNKRSSNVAAGPSEEVDSMFGRGKRQRTNKGALQLLQQPCRRSHAAWAPRQAAALRGGGKPRGRPPKSLGPSRSKGKK
ncbi:hypothetical protein DUNSADRAFT_5882, partial [Dunaliella salina]